MPIGIGLGLTPVKGGAVPFAPNALFAQNEIGTWYDPSDVANTNWRYNLLTYTEQFDNAAWQVSGSLTVTTNQAVAPDGTLTADQFVTTGSSSSRQSVTVIPGATYRFSFFAKNNSGTAASYRIYNNTNASDIIAATSYLNQINGTDWTRVEVTFTAPSGCVSAAVYPVSNTAGVNVFIWGAQLNTGSTALPYQQITDPNAQTIALFPSATLYQDSAGTTAVTAPAQSVGLMLDKSKGLVLGPELVTNGTFVSNTDGWSIRPATQGVISWNNGAMRFERQTGLSTAASQLISSFVVGRWYKISADVRVVSDAGQVGIQIRSSDGGGGSDLSSGTVLTSNTAFTTQTVYWLATQTTGYISLRAGSDNTVVEGDNISVRELPGNHATASGTTRPIYAIVPKTGRRNLLTYSEQFDNAAWTTSAAPNIATISANSSVAPDGTTTADTLTAATGGTSSQVRASLTGVANTSYSASVYLKAGTSAQSRVLIRDNTAGTNFIQALVNWSGGVPTLASTTGTCTVTSVGSGWYRFVGVASSGASANPNLLFSVFPDSTAGTASTVVWGAQLETGSTATAYQKVVTQYEVTEAGVPSLSYLSFDGVDDFMVTGTITPGTDKAQVFAGVRKLSDAAVGMISEYGTSTGSNNGSFNLYAPGSNGSANFGSNLRGTAEIGYGMSTFAAPFQAVLSSQFDLSVTTLAAAVRPRVNGVLTQSSGFGSNPGGGNFGNYATYIGRRAGSTFPFNGNLYGLITRFGPNLSSALITQTEQWLNTKTQAF